MTTKVSVGDYTTLEGKLYVPVKISGFENTEQTNLELTRALNASVGSLSGTNLFTRDVSKTIVSDDLITLAIGVKESADKATVIGEVKRALSALS